VRQEPVHGDGHGARYAQREVYFDGRFVPTQLYRRDRLAAGDKISGPAMITEYTAATVLPPGDELLVDAFGNLVICIDKGGQS
jgi:N-methylhydantoinase A